MALIATLNACLNPGITRAGHLVAIADPIECIADKQTKEIALPFSTMSLIDIAEHAQYSISCMRSDASEIS